MNVFHSEKLNGLKAVHKDMIDAFPKWLCVLNSVSLNNIFWF